LTSAEAMRLATESGAESSSANSDSAAESADESQAGSRDDESRDDGESLADSQADSRGDGVDGGDGDDGESRDSRGEDDSELESSDVSSKSSKVSKRTQDLPQEVPLFDEELDRPFAEPDTITYIGSADLMHRNISRRVEILVPVLSRRNALEVDKIIDTCLTDQALSWTLQDDRWYPPVGDGLANEVHVINAHQSFEDQVRDLPIVRTFERRSEDGTL